MFFQGCFHTAMPFSLPFGILTGLVAIVPFFGTLLSTIIPALLTQIETFLGVSGPADYPWGPPRTSPYRHPPLPLNGAAQLMQRGCEALGLKTSPAANAALSRPQMQEGYGLRPACTNRGFCQAGCSTGAKVDGPAITCTSCPAAPSAPASRNM